MRGLSDPVEDWQEEPSGEAAIEAALNGLSDVDQGMIERLAMWITLTEHDPIFVHLPLLIQEMIIDMRLGQMEENKPVQKASDVAKDQLKQRWPALLKDKHLADGQEPETECCVCQEDESLELHMDHIPCDATRLHSSKICIECLSTIIANPKADGVAHCPLCNTRLLATL